MTKFAFVIHPIEAKDAARKYPALKFFPDSWIEAFMGRKKPVLASHITGIQSITGATTEGWFIGLPMTPRMMMETYPIEFAYDQIVRCCELAKSLGADIIGLGAFSSIVGDGGVTIAKRSPIAVTTGNSYTVATAIQAAERACELIGIQPSESILGIVGATGSIGKTCATVLAPHFSRSILVGRDEARVQAVADELPNAVGTADAKQLISCDVVITVSSAGAAIVMPEHLMQGAIVIDVARPRDVSIRVAKERPDVLVIEGGVVSVPGDVNFNFSFGFPPKTAYACMSETMMLALDERAENFSIGRDITVEQVKETLRLAEKHGFELSGFRSFERAVDEAAIVRARDARKQRVLVAG